MNESLNLNLKYYAVLREQRGLSSEKLSLQANTPNKVYAYLKLKYGFSLKADVLKVSINNEYQCMDTTLVDGDNLVFIPPVAGG